MNRELDTLGWDHPKIIQGLQMLVLLGLYMEEGDISVGLRTSQHHLLSGLNSRGS